MLDSVETRPKTLDPRPVKFKVRVDLIEKEREIKRNESGEGQMGRVDLGLHQTKTLAHHKATSIPFSSISLFIKSPKNSLTIATATASNLSAMALSMENEATATEARFAPVTRERRVRNDLETTIPKPCEPPKLNLLR